MLFLRLEQKVAEAHRAAYIASQAAQALGLDGTGWDLYAICQHLEVLQVDLLKGHGGGRPPTGSRAYLC